ncbi:conserved hypothetical protein [Ixodes scapularis]|uniref:BBSome-interacting protein 1 n=1 Tax=Ixodes scapularis TaxID=6945 RepID=B7PU94_IXOSC|nr:conserved hypothetical protein [Ixodes scapularis]|eukprot:XP_002405744.1 conserved hypothetical protein [Ixodes scapularis]
MFTNLQPDTRLFEALENAGAVHEVVPSRGEQFQECRARPVLCRPKLLPLQSMSLEKLERLQAEAQQRARQST